MSEGTDIQSMLFWIVLRCASVRTPVGSKLFLKKCFAIPTLLGDRSKTTVVKMSTDNQVFFHVDGGES